MLNEIVNISSGFQTSVNIAFDLKNNSKIHNFIPTNSSVELINNLLSGTKDGSTERAKILSGAYGRGKSHIVLVTLSILSEGRNVEFYSKLLNKMKSYDENIYKNTVNYLESKKKLLPVVISGSTSSLTQAFLNALQQALRLYKLEDIMPDSHFHAAIEMIESWEINYPDTYEELSKKLDCSQEDLKKELEHHNTEYYKKFIEVYPSLTAGSVFNPFVESDVVNIFENVSRSIKSYGYDGLYIVYDEFGKYLETNIATATESDTKFLQDFAEKCNRSGSNQMHFLLICHKDISNYIDMNLSQDKVDGWRGISGRFEHINLQNNFSQMYEIIASTIEKNKERWANFESNNKKVFEELSGSFSTSDKSIFYNLNDVYSIITGCYPLHPSTIYILPRLSEKVAQNERTLFTYLSANQKNTLVEFIENNNDELPFVTPDCLFDYFEQQFKKELNSSELYKTYNLASIALKKVESNSLHAKIIKTIALIYMLEQFEKLPPTEDIINKIFINSVNNPIEIKNTIQDLIDRSCIVYLKRSNNYLKLKKSSGVNTREQIRERTEQLKLKVNVRDILNNIDFDSYLYPVRYNDEHCITRYFEFVFTRYEEIIDNYYNADKDASGLVQAVFFENADEFSKFKNDVPKLSSKQVIIIKPEKFIDISSIAYEYKAVHELREESFEDDVLYDEYGVYLEDLEELMFNFITDYTQPDKKNESMNKSEHNCLYYSSEGQLKFSRKAQVSDYLSKICENVYSRTPKINNESLNKNILPTVAINSRTKLITAILECDNKFTDDGKLIVSENLGLTGTGQDVSFMRSSLMQTGIYNGCDGFFTLCLTPEDDSMTDMLTEISSFFKSSSTGEKSFKLLYDTLTMPKYGIGVKRGVIPVYIALVLAFVKENIVIRSDKSEVKINATTLNEINDNPGSYSVIMENWDDEKKNYLHDMETIFSDYIIDKEKSYNGFTYIAAAMYRWYMSLPRCAKEMKCVYGSDEKISSKALKFISSLKRPSENSRCYLIEELAKIFDLDVSLKLSKEIKTIKNDFDNARIELVNAVISETKQMFNGSKEESLTFALKDWHDALKHETLQYQFQNNENKILSLIEEENNNEFEIAENLAKPVVGLRIDDWNNETIEKYRTGIARFKATVEDYNDKDHSKSSNTKDTCKITFYDDNGSEVVRVFDKVEYSPRAKLLYSDISCAIQEMGQSITEQEKRQVLVEILEKMFR